jgi:hypothetical protein
MLRIKCFVSSVVLRRKFLGLYAPTLEVESDGSVGAVEMPDTQLIPPP